MSNNILPFSFDGNTVRIVKDQDDDPWFVLVDVCEVLGLTNASMVADRVDDDERDELSITDAIGRSQMTTVVNEPGLYDVIFQSRKPIAKRFKRWVKHEVLPSIRKTGSYHHGPMNSRDDLLAVVERLVEPIKGRFAAHEHQLDDHETRLEKHEDRISKVESNILVLRSPRSRRREIPASYKAQLCAGVAGLAGWCPCCGRVKIVDEDSNLIRDENGDPRGEADHHYDVGKVLIDHIWLICTDCHRKLTYPHNKPEWPRPYVDARFRAFQEKVAPIYQQLRRQPSLFE